MGKRQICYDDNGGWAKNDEVESKGESFERESTAVSALYRRRGRVAQAIAIQGIKNQDRSRQNDREGRLSLSSVSRSCGCRQ